MNKDKTEILSNDRKVWTVVAGIFVIIILIFIYSGLNLGGNISEETLNLIIFIGLMVMLAAIASGLVLQLSLKYKL